MSSPPLSSQFPGAPDAKKRKYGRVSSIKDVAASRLQIASSSQSMVLKKSTPITPLDSTMKNKTSFPFESLPPNVFEVLMKKLSFKEKLILRNTSKTLLQMVDSQKINIGVVCVEVTEKEVEFEIDELKCKYVAMDYGCRVVVGEDKSKEFPMKYAWDLAKQDLRRLLNLTDRIEKLVVSTGKHTEFFFKDLAKTLAVRKADIQSFSIPRVLLLLSMLDPCHLREVRLICESSEGVETIFETDQFRMASSWDMSVFCEEVHLEHFWNFEKFEIVIPSVTLLLVQKVIEKMFSNPNLAYCKIYSMEAIDLSEIGLALKETVTNREVRHSIPIPGEDRFLEIVLTSWFLKAQKVSKLEMDTVDVPIYMDDTLFQQESMEIEENVTTYRPNARYMAINVPTNEPESPRALIGELAFSGLKLKNIRHVETFFEADFGFYTYYFDIVADEETEEGRKLIGNVDNFIRRRSWMVAFHFERMQRFRMSFSHALSPNQMMRAMVVASGYGRLQPPLDLLESINDKQIVDDSLDAMREEHGGLDEYLTEEGQRILKDVEEGNYY
ncbi:unnamed protein product [Caenorhabditis nigoni]